MQLYNKIKQYILPTIITTVFIFTIFVVPKAYAEYSRDAYGSCAYGQSCPNTSDSQGTNPPGDTSPTTPNTTTPVGPGTTTPNNNRSSSGGPNSNTSISPLEKVVLSRRTILVQKLTPTQQKIAPLLLWILLIILAIILLIQSIFDRLRAKKLQMMIHELNVLIEDKKNFVRLVMHHINTPIATIKSTTELLNSVKPTEDNAIHLLEPVILSLAAIAHDVDADTDVENKQAQTLLHTKPEITYANMLSRWYFLLPVVIAMLFGVGTSWVIVSSGVSFSLGYWLFLVSFSIMSTVVLFNALRLWRLGRERNKQLHQIKMIMNQLNQNRQKTIEVLSTTLQNTIYKLQNAKSKILNPKYAKFIQDSTDQLQLLANKVSVTSRPLTNPQKFNIGTILNSAINRHKQMVDEKHIVISNISDTTSEVPIRTDEVYFITDSLIDNAIRYNNENGTVQISSKIVGNSLRIEIDDSGKGLSSDMKQQLYEPFSKTEGVVTFDQSGMGLSLYASKILVSRLGGNLKLSSSEGHGTQASLIIPIPL